MMAAMERTIVCIKPVMTTGVVFEREQLSPDACMCKARGMALMGWHEPK